MDFLNKSFAQLSDLFKQMTPATRMLAALLLVAVVVSLGYLFTNNTSGGDLYLLGGQSFSSSEVSAMEAAFGKAKLSGYTLDGTRIRIPRGQQAAFMAALADHAALPAHFGDYLTDATMKVSQFTSRAQQEEMIKTAKQRELALIIRSMNGIEKAAVHYDTQKRGGLRAGSVTTASVSVKPAGSQPLDEKQVPMIRHLVAGAIAGLSPEAVTVVDLNGRTYSGNSNGSVTGSAMDDPYLARVKEYQAMYEQMISHALSYVPGATITAQVELDRELIHRSEKDTYDPKGSAVIQSREETGTSSTEGATGGGRPGLEAQGANQAARLSPGAGGPKSSDEKTTTETTNALSHEILKVDRAPLTPRRVTASVAVPSSYFESVWRRRNPAAAGQPAKEPEPAALDAIQREETEKIRAHVEKILPPPTAGTADATTPIVTVTTFLTMNAADIPEAASTDRVLYWLGNWWNTLALIGLVGVSLLMLRSLMRSIPQSSPTNNPPPAVAGAYQPETEPTDDVPEEKAKSRLKRRVSGPSLREELVEIVREDPDAAANILRSWIGNAS